MKIYTIFFILSLCFLFGCSGGGGGGAAGDETGAPGSGNPGSSDPGSSDPGTSDPEVSSPFIKQFGASNSPTSTQPNNNLLDENCFDGAIDDTGVYCAAKTSGHIGDLNGGSSDFAVVKFSLDGTLLWVKQLGQSFKSIGIESKESDACSSITVFEDAVYCGGYTRSNMDGENSGENDIVVVKLSKENGDLQWVKQITDDDVGSGDAAEGESCSAIAVDASGIYCAGGTESNLGEVNAGDYDPYVMKLVEDTSDPENTVVSVSWVKQIGKTEEVNSGLGVESAKESNSCRDISIYGDYIYCVGHTNGSLADTNLTPEKYDIFILKVSKSDGSVTWLKQLGDNLEPTDRASEDKDEAYSIVVNDSGIFIGGNTRGSFGEENGGSSDVLVMKMLEDETSGALSFDWVKQLGNVSEPNADGSSNTDYCKDIALDATHLYCAGESLGNLGETSSGSWDGVMMKFSLLDGSVSWVKHIKEDSDYEGLANSGDYCNGVVVNSSGVYCVGRTNSSIYEEANSDDIFIAKIDKDFGSILAGTQLGSQTYIEHSETFLSAGLPDSCSAVKVDNSHIYCAGSTEGYFADTNGGDSDILIMKILKDDLSIVWVKQLGESFGAGTNRHQGCEALGVDDDYVYCGGGTSGDLGEVGVGFNDAFVVKLSKETGNVEWLKQFGSSFLPGDTLSNDDCYGLAIDDDGIYCAGGTRRDFGTAGLNGGSRDAYVVKISKSNGDVLWVNQLGQPFEDLFGEGKADESEYFNEVVVDEYGVVCAGSTWGSLGETNAGDGDIIFARFDKETGAVKWVKQIGQETLSSKYGEVADVGVGFEDCYGLSIYENGIYCGGSTYGNLSEINAGKYDAVVLKLIEDRTDPENLSVELDWIKQLGSTSVTEIYSSGTGDETDECYGLAVDETGIYCAGATGSSLGEGNGGGKDAFILKLSEESDSSGNTSASIENITQIGSSTERSSGASSANDYCNSVVLDTNYVYCGGTTYGGLGEDSAGKSDIYVWGLPK